MFSYYTAITLLSIAALLVLCVLVHENGRIQTNQRSLFYLTYLFIGLAAIAEWSGIQMNGNDDIPHWVLMLVKCADYILTPMAGGAIIRQMGIRNVGFKILNITLVINTAFQVVAAFFGWMITIDAHNNYAHGPLYFVYIIEYLCVIAIVIVEFLIYGKGFVRQNRYSLYSIMTLVLAGILLQEIFGGEFRTAYISLTLGAALLFIHYVEYAQLDAEDRINEQERMLNYDALTGLLNRYAYSKALNKFDADGELPNNLAAVSIDINGLKMVNDSLGHTAGDELICGAAKCIKEVYGEVGRCYRTGGDEFIVLANIDREKADALLNQLSDKTNLWDGTLIHNLSLSAGYALVSEYSGVSAEKLVYFADRGMYEEKSRYYNNLGDKRRAYVAEDNYS